ncbi:DUF262 domain-containing protein [Micrococcus luteus]|uniref:DUF262 domain-containing protein n=1 Tax=Micrococcus luteus TaxID=1270 RepID=UPI0019102F15|nr:DUF262 domain-containing protein [Micrococcus luteus]QQE49092.1 DUF262 domain-containing protein [Micrococcus luteus]
MSFEQATAQVDEFESTVESEADGETQVSSYDIVSSPNDWNFSTIVSFIESKSVRIPIFQRNYVWDRKRASKLIESLIIGLPVPQVFLYEEQRNKFIVIDGQQRLLTLYFFAKGRFPKPKVRGELRRHLIEGMISQEVLDDDNLFEPFKLSLPRISENTPNRFHGLTYLGLAEDRISLDLRTMRNVVVKQTSPEGDSAMFEIFNRLNTGGVNLTPQEIRASLYNSPHLNKVIEFNLDSRWRELLGRPTPDPRMRDTEILLRALALARRPEGFSGSMANFVNSYCADARRHPNDDFGNLLAHLNEFVTRLSKYSYVFVRAGKFSSLLFESSFAAWSATDYSPLDDSALTAAISTVRDSAEFAGTMQEGSTKSRNVSTRIKLVQEQLESVM